jgi:hypothetical protein
MRCFLRRSTKPKNLRARSRFAPQDVGYKSRWLQGQGVKLKLISLAALALCGCATTERVPPQFAVGDVVLARHFTNYPQLNGTQVRVTGEFKWRWIKGGNTLRCYAIETVDGQELAAQSFQLQTVTQRSL